MRQVKERLLIQEALRWVGVKEEGNNGGQLIQLFQKAVDNHAANEPWCLSFVQFCIKAAEAQYNVIQQNCDKETSKIFLTEHCLTCWTRTDYGQRNKEPEPGNLIIWQHFKNKKPTPNGHVGIIVEVKDENTVVTVEGNTSDSSGVEREGQGVYKKIRRLEGTADMMVLGFLRVWN